MASLDEVISKIPRPILVGGIFIIALFFIVLNDPLKDGCDAEIATFKEYVKGYAINTRTQDKKTKFAEINTTKNFCKDGNSAGSCGSYFAALYRLSEAFVGFDYKCMSKLVVDENFSQLESQLKEGLKILALAAWGERPPAGLAERMGWLSRNELYSFCRLKSALIEIIGEANFLKYRQSVMREFPDAWPDHLKNQLLSIEDLQRPRALKWSGNLSGTLTEEEVLLRSLFSLRCDQYQ